jgi:hypothetical protein
MLTPIQTLIPNVQNVVYSSILPNVIGRESIIPHVSIPLTKKIMDQILVGFPNSMYPHVGTYTPYFGFGYGGIGRVPILWPPMFNPFANPIAPPQPILGIAQIGVVIDHKEPLDEDMESFERKHNPKMP